VLGGSESGVGAALLAKKHGLDVFVSDAGIIKPKYKAILQSHKILFEEQRHSINRIPDIDLVIKSPGISDSAPIIQTVKKTKPVVSEIEFASWFTNAKIIGITGSNGKTTTTLLTGHILRSEGTDVCVAGNVGHSFAGQLAENEHDVFVLELSSFQLDDVIDFRPDIAVITNITPDHLDRYDHDFDKYAKAKLRITMNQRADDALVYCADDAETEKQIRLHNIKAKKYPFSIFNSEKVCAFTENGKLNINIYNNSLTMTLEELALQGRHNTYNSMAAGISARLINIRKETVRQSLSDYQNIAHRLEFVANVHGASYYNDSKATNVNSAWYALEHFDRPIIWIAGGVDKGNDYSSLLPLVQKKVKAIVCLGTDNKTLHDTFKDHVEMMVDVDSAEQAVAVASLLAAKNDIVLLSPACASFDLFENFEERGDKFKSAVKSL
jgi:UDP-N-acetylmuramoylalanine--D-glutamate ligase